MSLTSYVRTVALTSVASLLIGVTIIVLIDPKGLYDLVRSDGFNSFKAYQNLYYGEVKALALRRYRPDTIVGGASPVTFGLVPECRDSSMPGVSRIYNYGGAGAYIGNVVVNYLDLRAVGSIRRIAMEAGLPGERFLRANDTLVAPMEPPHGFWADAIRRWIPANYAGAYLGNLFSWHEVLLSAQTFAANRQSDRSFLFHGFEPNGAYDQTWLRRWFAWVITEGNLRGHIINYRNLLLAKVSNDVEVDVSYVDLLAATAGRDGIALDLYVRPEHVSELLLYYEGGIWPLFEKYKRTLLRAANAARSRHGADIRVFDFGNLSDAVLQPIRPIDEHTLYDPYFTDPIHYRKPVGDFILATMYGCHIDQQVPSEFGIELDTDNIDAHLANEKAKLEAYRRADPELVRKVQSALRD
jgi:hypothetical protein